MESRNKINAAATFGAGLAALTATTSVDADVVDLTFTPSSVLSNAAVSVTTTALSPLGVVDVFNGYINDFLTSGGYGFYSMFVLSPSQPVSPYTQAGAPMLSFSSGTGTRIVGFNHPTGNVGWFSVDLGQPGDPMVFTGGQYGTDSEPLHAGVFIAVPEPSAATGLALLALGAAGVRRRKKDCQSQAAP